MGGGGFRFEKNARVKIDGVQLRILKKQPNGPWQLEQTSTGTIVEYQDQELFELHYKGSLQFVGETSRVHSRPVHRELSETEKAEVHWRLHFVTAVKGIIVARHGYESAIEAAWTSYKTDSQKETTTPTSRRRRLGHTRPPGWITVYRWKIRYEQSGDNEYSLLNKAINKAASLNPDVSDLIDEALNEVYLIRERNPLQEAVNASINKRNDENDRRGRLGLDPLKLPTRRDVQLRLSLIPAFDVYAARFGRQAALTKFRFVRGHRVTSHALERCEIDHTPLDLFVVDDQ
jgi:putative transposase